MRFFEYDDNEEYQEEIDGFFDEMSEEELFLLESAQMNFTSQDSNQKLLWMAIRILEKSFFWKFRKKATKLKMIESTYESLIKILD